MRLDPKNPASLAMLGIGVLLMGAALAYSIIVPEPDAKKAVQPVLSKISTYKHQIVHDKGIQDSAITLTQARLWSDPDDRIAPKTLKILTDLAAKYNLKVSSFRPQKETAAGALMILPFFVSLDGAFPDVGNFIKEFEEKQQTLILDNVQIASSDQNTHAVTASLEVSAYIDPNRDTASADVASKAPATQTPSSAKAAAKAIGRPTRSKPQGAAKA